MSVERPDVVFYDSGANIKFANALVETLVIPAYLAALDRGQEEELEVGDVIRDKEVLYEGNRTQYEFLAQQSEQVICIVSTTYSVLEDLSEAGAQLIHDDIQAASVLNNLKDRYRNKPELLQSSAMIETFVRRSFLIWLVNDANEVRVNTQVGYSVNGLEVANGVFLTEDVEPELERDTVFDANEVEAIIRPLLELDLIKEENVRHFLDQSF